MQPGHNQVEIPARCSADRLAAWHIWQRLSRLPPGSARVLRGKDLPRRSPAAERNLLPRRREVAGSAAMFRQPPRPDRTLRAGGPTVGRFY